MYVSELCRSTRINRAETEIKGIWSALFWWMAGPRRLSCERRADSEEIVFWDVGIDFFLGW